MSDAAPAAIVMSAIALLLSLTVHEAAHAWTANRLGDPTARLLGRISLNPLVHIDLIGTVVLPIVAMATGAPLIGWAKPVPVDTRRLGRMPRDFVAIAAAGPTSNILLAFLASLVLRFGSGLPSAAAGLSLGEPVQALAWSLFQVNLLLAVFNMIPVPPLDGGNVLGGLLRGRLAEGYAALRPYGVFILYALMFSGAMNYLVGPPFLFLARLLTL